MFLLFKKKNNINLSSAKLSQRVILIKVHMVLAACDPRPFLMTQQPVTALQETGIKKNILFLFQHKIYIVDVLPRHI